MSRDTPAIDAARGASPAAGNESRTMTGGPPGARLRVPTLLKGPAVALLRSGARHFPGLLARVAAAIEGELGPARRAPRRPRRRPLEDFVRDLAAMDERVGQVELVEGLVSHGALTRRELHLYLAHLFSARHIEVLEAVLERGIVSDPCLALYHRTRIEHYRGRASTSARELRCIHEALPERDFLRRPLLALTLEQAVRDPDVPLLLEILSGLDDARLAALPPRVVLGAYRLLARSRRLEECRALLRRYVRASPRHHHLYLLEPVRALLPSLREGALDPDLLRDWREVLEELDRSRADDPAADREAFTRLVTDRLRAIPGGPRELMDLRFRADQRAWLLGHVAGALEDGRPLSFLRLGDGEAYAYDPPEVSGVHPERFSADDVVRERHWWGTRLEADRRAEIRRAVREAIAGADVLGIPSVYRVVRDLGAPGRPFGSGRAQRGLLVVLGALGSAIPLRERVLTEERSHQILFDGHSLRDLASRARRVVVVSCWPPEKLPFLEGLPVDSVRIAPHAQVRRAVDGSAGAPPVFRAWREIAAQVAERAGPGVLVLVAAGIVGKIFIDRARREGAVALDVGAVFDYLAGYKTRNIADMV